MILALLTRLGIPQWCAEVLCGALIVALLTGGGYYKGFHDKSESDQVAAGQAQLDHAAQLLKQQAISNDISAKYEAERSRSAALEAQLQQRVPNVTVSYRPAPGAPLETLPRCIFTGGYLSLWNSALDPALPDAGGGSAQPTAAADSPGADLDSGLTEADVLHNHIANAAECAAVRQQLNSLIDFFEQTKTGN